MAMVARARVRGPMEQGYESTTGGSRQGGSAKRKRGAATWLSRRRVSPMLTAAISELHSKWTEWPKHGSGCTKNALPRTRPGSWLGDPDHRPGASGADHDEEADGSIDGHVVTRRATTESRDGGSPGARRARPCEYRARERRQSGVASAEKGRKDGNCGRRARPYSYPLACRGCIGICPTGGALTRAAPACTPWRAPPLRSSRNSPWGYST